MAAATVISRWGLVDENKLLSGSVSASGEALVQELPDGEAIFLNLATEEYFGVDAVGARMWRALTGNGTIDAARDELIQEFDVEPAQLEADLQAFLRELVARGLVDLSPG